jgi:hypothetical protein
MFKRQLRIEDYQARADAASERAQVCNLPRVREQYEAAASTWRALAEAEQHWLLQSQARLRQRTAPPALDRPAC